MKFKIKNRWNGELIFECEALNIRLAVEKAIEAKANLSLANLRSADLSLANLRSADLSLADLSSVVGVNPHLMDDLRILRFQVGPIRAFKLVTGDLKSPMTNGPRLQYTVGEVAQAAASTDEYVDCAAGVNVATLPWCLRNWQDGWRILIVEFVAADIAAIPVNTDGKFRVHRCRVVEELDLASIGWPAVAP